MAVDRGLSAFDNLSSREKAMVIGLAGSMAVLIVLIAVFWLGSVLGEMEEEIAFNAEFLEDIEEAVIPYRLAQAHVQADKKRIDGNNVVSLRLPVNKIARGVVLPDGKKLSDMLGSLDKQIETPIDTSGKKVGKKRGKEKVSEGDVMKVEQDVQFRNVPLDSLFEFLDGIRKSDLLFVTRLEIKRKFGSDFTNAQSALVTVMTLRGQGEVE